jgi:hypothetical protein
MLLAAIASSSGPTPSSCAVLPSTYTIFTTRHPRRISALAVGSLASTSQPLWARLREAR